MGENTLIAKNEHVFVPGMTGSGKSFLAETYLNSYENVIVLDTKGYFNWLTSKVQVPIFTHLGELGQHKEGRAIYRPDFTELSQEFYNAFFQWVYMRKNTIVYIDELMEVCPSPRTYPLFLKGLLTRGRELGIGVWMSTQRPKDIPTLCMNQSTHHFIFFLQQAEDRDTISRAIEQPIVRTNAGLLKDHVFWYYNASNGEIPVRARLKIK